MMKLLVFLGFTLCALPTSSTSSLVTSLGVAGAGATENGYDTGTFNPICWSGVSSEVVSPSRRLPVDNVDVFRIERSTQSAARSLVRFENPLVANFTLAQRLQVEPACNNGIELHVTPPPEFSRSEPRTRTVYNYSVQGRIDLDSFFPANTTITNDRNTSEIGVQVFLCKLENLGFCSPLVHTQSTPPGGEDMEAPPSPGAIHDSSHVDSLFVLADLKEDNSFNVQVPLRVDKEGGYSVVGSILLFRTAIGNDQQTGSPVLYADLVANMPNTTQDRVVYFQDEPEILEVSRSARITAIVLSTICGLFLVFLLYHLVRYRKSQVLKLVQGDFLSVMLVAAITATSFSFSFEPSQVNCHLTGPFVVLPIHLMCAVSAGRLWRINAVISPLLLLTLDKKKDTFSQRMVKWIQAFVMCSRRTNIRRQITDLHLARVILFFTLPQILIQIAIAVVQPNTLVLEFNDDETVGTYHCGEEGLFRSPLEATSLLFLIVMLMIVLLMAGSSRDLPSLFNETKVLFDVTLLAAVIIAIACIVVVVSDTASTTPDVWYLVCVLAVLALCVSMSFKIVIPKLQKVWSGEVVFVSKLIADHNQKKRGSASGGMLPTYSDYRLNVGKKEAKPSETSMESSIEFLNKQNSMREIGNEETDRPSPSDGDNDIETGQQETQRQDQQENLQDAAGQTSRPRLGKPHLGSSRDLHSTDDQHQDAPTMTERVSAELQTPGRHVFEVSEDQPPSRQLLLPMIDLQQLLQKVNRNILAGLSVEQEEWERVRKSATILGRVFGTNVRFSWEGDSEFDEAEVVDDPFHEGEPGTHNLFGPLSTVIDDSKEMSCTSRDTMTTQQLGEIATSLRTNVEVKDRQYRLVKYKQCFIASEAVDFLVTSRVASSRAEAVRLGKQVAKTLNLFEHVTNDHEFADDYLFFRFVGINSIGNTALAHALFEISEEVSNDPIESDSHISLGPDWRSDETRLDHNLARVAVALRRNVKVKDRRYHMSSYKQCFIASEAVDYFVFSGIAKTREEGVEIGVLLAEKYNIMEHVCNDHKFRDDYLFFRFVDASARESELDMSIHSVNLSGNTISEVSELNSDIGSSMVSGAKSPWKAMSDESLAGLAKNFKSSVEVEDRKYRAKVYKKCFLGSEAVDFFVGAGYTSSRRDAVQLGRHLAKKFNLFEHVCGDHKLKDGFLFFRFNESHSSLEIGSEHGSRSQVSGKVDDGSGSIASSQLSHHSSPQQHWEQLSDAGLSRIALALRRGVPVKDRRYHLVLFRKCFVGRQAVDFLVNSGMAISRKDATRLASTLMSKFDLFEHVTREHGMTDGYRFYRFLDGNSAYKEAIRSQRRGSESGSYPSSVGTSDRSLPRMQSMPSLGARRGNDLSGDRMNTVQKDERNDAYAISNGNAAPHSDALLTTDKSDRVIQTINEGDATTDSQDIGGDLTGKGNDAVERSLTVKHPYQSTDGPQETDKEETKRLQPKSDSNSALIGDDLGQEESLGGVKSSAQAQTDSSGRARERVEDAKQKVEKAMQAFSGHYSPPGSPKLTTIDMSMHRINESESDLHIDSEEELQVDSGGHSVFPG